MRNTIESSRGFSLIELMVAMAIGLLLVAGMGAIFANTTRSNREMAEMNKQIENGRFAIQALRDNLQHAGFWGELVAVPAGAALVNPCTNYTAWTTADKTNVLGLPVQGYANGAGIAGCTLTNRKNGTDVLVINQVATCTPGTTDCANGQLALQISLCGDDPIPWVMDPPGSPSFTLRRRDNLGRPCTRPSYSSTPAFQRRVMSTLYYVRDHASAVGDNIPTLMAREPNGAGAQPLVEGIEFLRLEYGIDSAGNDGVPDAYVSDTTAMTLADWRNVVAVKVHVLARNLEPSPGYTDNKVYTLPGGNAGPFNDGFKRHAYQATIRLINPAGRRAP